MWRFYEKGKNGRNRLRFMSAFNLQRYFPQTGVQVFSSPSVIYRHMTAKMKVIKTQSDFNSSDFPMGKTSSVTPPDSLKECLLRFVSHVQLEAASAQLPTHNSLRVCFSRKRLSTSNHGGYHDMLLKVKFV